MCDYSLHGVASRPARVGDKLVSTSFRNSITRGFATSEQPDVAVCLMPGTELAFDGDVEGHVMLQGGAVRNFGHKVARFRQLNIENPIAHHDAIEFANGETLLVTNLREGQTVTVLQLPSSGHGAHEEAKEPTQEAAPTQQSLFGSNV